MPLRSRGSRIPCGACSLIFAAAKFLSGTLVA
jgi:hypothetical protein